jgi:spermidine/putrescine transport system substrate-binding protein
MEKVDPELVHNPLIFPDATVLAKASSFMALDETKAKQYESDFNKAIGS